MFLRSFVHGPPLRSQSPRLSLRKGRRPSRQLAVQLPARHQLLQRDVQSHHHPVAAVLRCPQRVVQFHHPPVRVQGHVPLVLGVVLDSRHDPVALAPVPASAAVPSVAEPDPVVPVVPVVLAVVLAVPVLVLLPAALVAAALVAAVPADLVVLSASPRLVAAPRSRISSPPKSLRTSPAPLRCQLARSSSSADQRPRTSVPRSTERLPTSFASSSCRGKWSPLRRV